MALTKVSGTVSNISAGDVGLGNVTNESKATMFSSPTLTGNLTIQQTAEVVNTLTGATGVITHDYATGSIWYHTGIAANFTANFTNVPTTDNRAHVVTLILVQGATPFYPNAVQVNSGAATIKWQDNITPTPLANKTEIVSFSLIRVGAAWVVVGGLSSYG